MQHIMIAMVIEADHRIMPGRYEKVSLCTCTCMWPIRSHLHVQSTVRLREATGEHIIDTADRIEAKLETWRAAYLDQILTQKFFPDVTGGNLTWR